MRGGVLQLTRWGLLDDIVAAGTPPVRQTTFAYADQRVDITIKSAHGVDALYAPRRTLLDPLLVRAAVDAGADVHHRTTVTDLLSSSGRVTGVRLAHRRRPILDVRAALVVGADGIRSAVARQLRCRRTRASVRMPRP